MPDPATTAGVRRRPRVAWLLDSREPTGTAVMTMRRAGVLADRAEHHVLALRPGPVPPAGSPLRKVGPAGGLAGEIALARADVVVSTSELTLASAVARRTGRARLVHVLHELPAVALARRRVARGLPAADWLLVPEGTDVPRLTDLVPHGSERIATAADFVLPEQCLLSSARAKVILAAGRLEADDAVLDLVDAFRLAAPQLPGWQLRIAGGGPGLPALLDHIAAHGLHPQVLALGVRHDLAEQYLDAGFVVRLAAPEAGGLSVLEALAAGVPVLGSTASPTVVRHVRSGVNGTVLDRVDVPAVAAAIVELADGAHRAALAEQARTARVGLLDADGRRGLTELLDRVLETGP